MLEDTVRIGFRLFEYFNVINRSNARYTCSRAANSSSLKICKSSSSFSFFILLVQVRVQLFVPSLCQVHVVFSGLEVQNSIKFFRDQIQVLGLFFFEFSDFEFATLICTEYFLSLAR